MEVGDYVLFKFGTATYFAEVADYNDTYLYAVRGSVYRNNGGFLYNKGGWRVFYNCNFPIKLISFVPVSYGQIEEIGNLLSLV